MEEDGKPVSQAQRATGTNFWPKPRQAAPHSRWTQHLETGCLPSCVWLTEDGTGWGWPAWGWNREHYTSNSLFSNGIKGWDSTPLQALSYLHKHNYQGTQESFWRNAISQKLRSQKRNSNRHTNLGDSNTDNITACSDMALGGISRLGLYSQSRVRDQSVLSSAPVPAPYYRYISSGKSIWLGDFWRMSIMLRKPILVDACVPPARTRTHKQQLRSIGPALDYSGTWPAAALAPPEDLSAWKEKKCTGRDGGAQLTSGSEPRAWA